ETEAKRLWRRIDRRGLPGVVLADQQQAASRERPGESRHRRRGGTSGSRKLIPISRLRVLDRRRQRGDQAGFEIVRASVVVSNNIGARRERRRSRRVASLQRGQESIDDVQQTRI